MSETVIFAIGFIVMAVAVAGVILSIGVSLTSEK